MKKVIFEMGKHYAFGFNYNGGIPNEIIVETPTVVTAAGAALFHFTHGHHSLGEYVKPEEVIAIGDSTLGTHSVSGWKGRYVIVQPEHPLMSNFTKL